VPLVVLLLLAGGALAWLLVPGNRVFPERTAEVVAATEAAALGEDVNRALEERVSVLRAALDGAVCAWDGTLVMPDGVTIEGLLPPDMLDPEDRGGAVRAARVDPILPPDAGRVQIPQAQGGFGETASLLAHIEARSAMVLVQGPRGLGTGTGFFVGPDLVVTNYHVIDEAGPDGIYVTNLALGSLQQAQLVKAQGPMGETGADFALLRVPGASQPSFQVLDSDRSLRLQAVIAAGYPGDLLRTDSQFRALREGDLGAVPELAVTDGTISAEQSFDRETSVIVHSAPISTGNSGGPLIDMCGRLIGVNTFVVQGPMRNLNFALSGGDLMRFLDGTEAVPTVVSSSCAPQVARPKVPLARAEGSGDAAQPLPPLDIPPAGE
jgi:S1-C subfamily serine protease